MIILYQKFKVFVKSNFHSEGTEKWGEFHSKESESSESIKVLKWYELIVIIWLITALSINFKLYAYYPDSEANVLIEPMVYIQYWLACYFHTFDSIHTFHKDSNDQSMRSQNDALRQPFRAGIILYVRIV